MSIIKEPGKLIINTNAVLGEVRALSAGYGCGLSRESGNFDRESRGSSIEIIGKAKGLPDGQGRACPILDNLD